MKVSSPVQEGDSQTQLRHNACFYLPYPYFLFDTSGTRIFANRAAEDLLEEQGSLLEDILRGLMERFLEEETADRLGGDGWEPRNLVHLGLGREHRLWKPEVFGVPSSEVGDAANAVGVILRDATADSALRAYVKRLVGTLGHEVKSPLTSIKLAVGMILEQRDGLDSESLEILGFCAKDVDRLLESVEDMLAFEGDTPQFMVPRFASVRPVALLRRVVEAHRVMAGGRHVALIVDPACEAVPEVYTDGGKLCYILNNYLINALKFSGEGQTVELSASCRDGHTVRLSVRDHGIGISGEEQKKVFAHQYHRRVGNPSGHGLGLSIARLVADALGASVGVDSELDRGSEFYVDVPRA